MQITQPWEIDLILWFREILPGMAGFFGAITALGSETFFLAFLPLLYWCVDRSTGARVVVLFLISTYVNSVAKLGFSSPRPLDDAADRLTALFPDGIEATREQYGATGNGFPSGHTQSAVVIWGYLAAQVSHLLPGSRETGRRLAPALNLLASVFIAMAALLILLIPLSRIYLAVHYPSDILGGYVLGIAMLILFGWTAPRTTRRLANLHLAWQLAIVILVTIASALIAPYEHTVTATAALLGMGTGFVLERRWVSFGTAGTLVQLAARYAVGILVLGPIYLGLKIAFATLEPQLLFRFVRYALLGLWSTLGAPWLFVKLGVAHRSPVKADSPQYAGA